MCDVMQCVHLFQANIKPGRNKPLGCSKRERVPFTYQIMTSGEVPQKNIAHLCLPIWSYFAKRTPTHVGLGHKSTVACPHAKGLKVETAVPWAILG